MSRVIAPPPDDEEGGPGEGGRRGAETEADLPPITVTLNGERVTLLSFPDAAVTFYLARDVFRTLRRPGGLAEAAPNGTPWMADVAETARRLVGDDVTPLAGPENAIHEAGYAWLVRGDVRGAGFTAKDGGLRRCLLVSRAPATSRLGERLRRTATQIARQWLRGFTATARRAAPRDAAGLAERLRTGAGDLAVHAMRVEDELRDALARLVALRAFRRLGDEEWLREILAFDVESAQPRVLQDDSAVELSLVDPSLVLKRWGALKPATKASVATAVIRSAGAADLEPPELLEMAVGAAECCQCDDVCPTKAASALTAAVTAAKIARGGLKGARHEALRRLLRGAPPEQTPIPSKCLAVLVRELGYDLDEADEDVVRGLIHMTRSLASKKKISLRGIRVAPDADADDLIDETLASLLRLVLHRSVREQRPACLQPETLVVYWNVLERFRAAAEDEEQAQAGGDDDVFARKHARGAPMASFVVSSSPILPLAGDVAALAVAETLHFRRSEALARSMTDAAALSGVAPPSWVLVVQLQRRVALVCPWRGRLHHTLDACLRESLQGLTSPLASPARLLLYLSAVFPREASNVIIEGGPLVTKTALRESQLHPTLAKALDLPVVRAEKVGRSSDGSPPPNLPRLPRRP